MDDHPNSSPVVALRILVHRDTMGTGDEIQRGEIPWLPMNGHLGNSFIGTSLANVALQTFSKAHDDPKPSDMLARRVQTLPAKLGTLLLVRRRGRLGISWGCFPRFPGGAFVASS